MSVSALPSDPAPVSGAPIARRKRLASWSVIGFFALLTLFLGSCPDGAMAGDAASGGGWLYQCPIARPFVSAP